LESSLANLFNIPPDERGEEAERLLIPAESLFHEGPLPDGTSSVEAGATTLRAVFGMGGIESTLEAARRVAALPIENP
jgi:hypothetical protein